MKRLCLLLVLLLSLAAHAQPAEQDPGDHAGHGHGAFNIDARQHAKDVDNAAYEFMVRNFYTQPWRDKKASTVLMGRALPIWILVVLMLLVRRFRVRT